MNLAGRSRDHVEDLLAELEDGYGSFPVSQTTVSVPAGCYEETVREWRQAVARVDVHVRNEAGEVLVLADDDEVRPPGSAVGPDESIEERARRAVIRSVGVECRIDGLQAVTIAGVQSEHDVEADPVYRLVALFAGTHVGGTPAADCHWHADPPASQLLI
jgi:ADP-ribose pyrophosphatase YjhB (NUDIX family)